MAPTRHQPGVLKPAPTGPNRSSDVARETSELGPYSASTWRWPANGKSSILNCTPGRGDDRTGEQDRPEDTGALGNRLCRARHALLCRKLSARSSSATGV